MSSNSERRNARIRSAMMTAAHALIIEKGYDAITVTEIAERADYGRSTFYLHFEDKEALIWAMLREYMQAVDAKIADSIVALESPLREWRAWYIIFSELDAQRPFFIQLEGELSRRIRQWQRDYLVEVFEQQLANGVFSLLLDVPPALAARFIVGSIIDILEYCLRHPEAGQAEEIAAIYFRMVFRQEPPEI